MRLFRFKMIESPMCTFCLKEVGSLEHLLSYCDTINSLNERRRNKITTIKSGVNGKGLGSDPFHLIEISEREKVNVQGI